MRDPDERHKYCAALHALYVAEPMDEHDRSDISKATAALIRMCERRSKEDRSDLEAARRALLDFEKRGGTSLEDLRKELGLEELAQQTRIVRSVRCEPWA